MKKNLRIEESNKIDIEASLRAANGKASAHAFTTYDQLRGLSVNAERALIELGLSASSRAGAKFTAQSGSAVCNSYSHTRLGTEITIVRRRDSWQLCNVRQITLFSSGGKSSRLVLTGDQDAKLVTALRRNYIVAPQISQSAQSS